MTVQRLLTTSIVPLAAGDAIGAALARMHAHGVQHLPVVSPEGRLVAVVSEEALAAQPDPALPLVALLGAVPVSASAEAHVFDVAHLLHRHALSVVPVVDGEAYAGLVRRQDVFGQLAHMLATEEPGAIVVLEVPQRDYSLGRLVQLVEGNGVRILSVATEDDAAAEAVRVTLKLNATDTARVRHLMAHYDYRVTAVFDEASDDLQGRVDAFMRYLEV